MSVIGELLLRIGIDPTSWSTLQSSLEDGKQEVTDFGTAAAAAGTVMDTSFASSITNISSSMQALASATDPVTAAQDELRAAFASTGVSMDTLDSSSAALGAALEEMGISVSAAASGAQAAAAAIETLPPALDQVKEHGAEASSAFEGFGENLAKMAEFAGVALTLESIAEVLKDIASESVTAFANLQLVSEGMTALTGSAQAAESILNQIKGIASSSIFSFPELAEAAQKMAALGVSAEQIPGAIQAIANAAEVTGNGLSGVASALDRIYLSGTVSTRGLTQLGLSLQDLADAAGISTAQVTQAFKGMGTESADALDILTYAMSQKVGPAAEDMASSLKVAINSVEVEWDSLLEEFGKDLAPGLINLAADVKAILPDVEQLASWFAQLASEQLSTLVGAWSDLATAVKEVWVALQPMEETFDSIRGVISSSLPDFVNYLTHIQDIADAAKLAKAGIDLLTGATQPLQIAATNLLQANTTLTEQVVQEQLAHDAAAAAAARHAAALAGLSAAAKQAGSDVDTLGKEEDQAFDKAGSLIDKINNALAGLGQGQNINLQGLEDQFTSFTQDLQRTGVAATDFGSSLVDNLSAVKAALDQAFDQQQWDKANQALQSVTDSLAKLNATDLDKLNASIDSMFDKLNAGFAKNPFDAFDQALKQLGLDADGDTSKMQKDFAAFDEVLASNASSLATVDGAWAKIQADVTKLAKDPGGLEEVVSLTTAYGDKLASMGAPLNQQLAAWVSIYNTQLKAAEAEGASAGQITLIGEALDNAKVKQAAFTDQSQGMLNLYTNIQNEFGAAWTEFGTGIGDAIAGTESFSTAFKNALSDMEKKLSELVTNFLLGQLKDAFLQNTNALQDFGNVFNSIFGVGGGSTSSASGAGGLESLPISGLAGGGNTASADTLGTVATNTSQMSQGITSMTSGIIGTLDSVVNMLTGIGQLITGIIQDIEQAHTNTLLDRIELNTRQTATYLGAGGGVIDFLAQMLPQVAEMSQGFQGWFHDALASLMTTVEDIDSKISSGGGPSGSGSSGSGGAGLDVNDLELAMQTAISNSGLGSTGSGGASTTSSLSNASSSLSDASSTISSAADTLNTTAGTVSSTFTNAADAQSWVTQQLVNGALSAAAAGGNTIAATPEAGSALGSTTQVNGGTTISTSTTNATGSLPIYKAGSGVNGTPMTLVSTDGGSTWNDAGAGNYSGTSADIQQLTQGGQNIQQSMQLTIDGITLFGNSATQLASELDQLGGSVTAVDKATALQALGLGGPGGTGALTSPYATPVMTAAQLAQLAGGVSTVPGVGLTGGGSGNPITVNVNAPINSAQSGLMMANTLASQLRAVAKL